MDMIYIFYMNKLWLSNSIYDRIIYEIIESDFSPFIGLL